MPFRSPDVKFAQWVLFLVLVFGSMVAVFASGQEGQRGILMLFCGISLSLWVFVFVPLFVKFYLSEALIAAIGLGLEMSLITMVGRYQKDFHWLMLIAIFAALMMPVIVFSVINRIRPKADQIEVEPPKKPMSRESRRRWAKLTLIVNALLILVALTELFNMFVEDRIRFSVLWLLGVNALIQIPQNLKVLRETTGDEAAK